MFLDSWNPSLSFALGPLLGRRLLQSLSKGKGSVRRKLKNSNNGKGLGLAEVQSAGSRFSSAD